MLRNDARNPLRLPRLAEFRGMRVRDVLAALGPLLLITLIAIGAAYRFIRPAPPDTIIITSGPDGSTFRRTAERYAKILARHGVTLQVLSSEGSVENLKRLTAPEFRVDIGFVQAGVAGTTPVDTLVSLGSVFHVPVTLFYRGPTVERISDLTGRRVAIGREGSGTRALALVLLKANGIEPGGKTDLLSLEGEAAAEALVVEATDAAFLMGDSATPAMMRKLLRTPGIRLVDFTQAEAYVRRFPYLNKFELPMGAFDLGTNFPAQVIHLIGPTVELVARGDLHPALSDLLIEAAREVHGRSTLFQRAGEFPAPREHEFRLGDDAKRYYSSGKRLLYRSLPFWLATLADRVLLVVPIVILLIPGLKLVPQLYRWRIRMRIYRWYGLLIALERRLLAQTTPEERQETLKRLDDIENQVNTMRMPLAFADQFYVLRHHIAFVRTRYAKPDGD